MSSGCPSAPIRSWYSSVPPARSLRKSSARLSGVQVGLALNQSASVTGTASPPGSVATSQIRVGPILPNMKLG